MKRLIAMAMLGALALSACARAGTGDGTPEPGPGDVRAGGGRLDGIPAPSSPPAGPPAPPAGTNPLPKVDVLEVDSGRSVNLGTLLPASKPVLVWFWAPH